MGAEHDPVPVIITLYSAYVKTIRRVPARVYGDFHRFTRTA
jgi:hypothetical protein